MYSIPSNIIHIVTVAQCALHKHYNFNAFLLFLKIFFFFTFLLRNLTACKFVEQTLLGHKLIKITHLFDQTAL